MKQEWKIPIYIDVEEQIAISHSRFTPHLPRVENFRFARGTRTKEYSAGTQYPGNFGAAYSFRTSMMTAYEVIISFFFLLFWKVLALCISESAWKFKNCIMEIVIVNFFRQIDYFNIKAISTYIKI